MKPFFPMVLFCAGMLTGCAFYKRAVWASPEEAEKVRFPNSFESGVHMDGPTTRALEVAMNEFIPPGSKAKADDERIARCLSRRENFDTSVLRVNDDLFFVAFSADLSRCGIDAILPDAGAVYAIDGRGRVLARQ
jgi:hypothetical protein